MKIFLFPSKPLFHPRIKKFIPDDSASVLFSLHCRKNHLKIDSMYRMTILYYLYILDYRCIILEIIIIEIERVNKFKIFRIYCDACIATLHYTTLSTTKIVEALDFF